MSNGKDKLWTGDRGTANAARFGSWSDRDELLHPERSIPGDSLTETWAYLWYIPEKRIYSQIHIWVHPNLNTVTAGIGVAVGHKNSMISSEIMDVPAFVSASSLGDGSDMKFANGMHVRIIEPFKKIHIGYDDPRRGNALDLTITGVSPPVMRGSENHFDQVVYNKGTVKLRGTEHVIDSYGIRDRSWGELRTEAAVAGPPFGWLTCIFPKSGISWNLAAFDDPARKPDWLGLFDVGRDELIHDSWLYRDGKLCRLKDASKITRRDPQTLRPASHEIFFRDEDNREYHITGKVTASIPWVGWPNMVCWVCLTEWTCNGETGYGDTQEVQWGDFHNALRQDQDPPPVARR